MNKWSVLDELEEKALKELRQLTQKDNITPTELEAMTKVTCLLEKIDMLRGEEMVYSEEYSRGPRMTHSSYRNSYEGSSYERGRSPVTGRYVSRDSGSYMSRNGGSYENGNSNNGYSGHSIQDRMIDRLERMMDEAESPYERQTIEKWIRRLSEE